MPLPEDTVTPWETVSALYIDPSRGPYVGMEGVDAWGLPRDARDYAGPYPVVAHPPCGHWGRLAWNCKQPQSFKDCGPRAVEQVRNYGGILEHPDGSLLWDHCGIPKPGQGADKWGGWTFPVEQVDWGHEARKRTWLYVVRVQHFPPLPPKGTPTRVMGVPRSKGRKLLCLPKSRRHLTPPAFARWLVDAARTVQPHLLAHTTPLED